MLEQELDCHPNGGTRRHLPSQAKGPESGRELDWETGTINLRCHKAPVDVDDA
jgi:hypothetical protein